MNESDTVYNSIMGIAPTPEEQEQSLIRELAAKGMSGLQYVGESLDKPGQALRGALSGNLKELWNLVPFSDAIGLTSSEGYFGKKGLNITDDEDNVTGRDLLEKAGILDPNTEGLDLGDALGLIAEIGLDPTTYLTGGATAYSKLGKAFQKAGQLVDPYVIAKRAGKEVFGQAGARHELTALDLLKQADDPAAAKAAVELAYNQGKPGKLLPDVTDWDNYHYADFAPTNPNTQWIDSTKYIDPKELLDPVGGLFNVRIPFTQGATARFPKVADKLDQFTGWLRYGNPLGIPTRGLNQLLDAGHSKGMRGESRYAQEMLNPNQRLHEQQQLNRLVPFIADERARLAQAGEDAFGREAQLPPQMVDGVLQETLGPERGGDLRQHVYRAIEGVGPDPQGLRPNNQAFDATIRDMLQKASIDQSLLHDPTIEHAARHKVAEEGTGEAGLQAAIDLLAQRNDVTRGLPGGTAQLIDLLQSVAEPVAKTRLTTTKGVTQADVIANLLRESSPALPEYSTTAGRQAQEQLAKNLDVWEPELVKEAKKHLSPDEFDTFRNDIFTTDQYAAVRKAADEGTGLDRYEGLAKFALGQDPKTLAAGVYMDPSSAKYLNAQAAAKQAARAMAFKDAIRDPNLLSYYKPTKAAANDAALIADNLGGTLADDLAPGVVVHAADQNNFGKILSLGPDSANVRFINPKTRAVADVTLPLTSLTPAKSLKVAGGPTSGMITIAEGAKRLGMNTADFADAGMIPEQLIDEILFRPDIPKTNTAMGSILNGLRNVTQLNKAFMTGAITNPSFPVRNRVSGAAENVYLGDIGPVAAAKGLTRSLADLVAGPFTDRFKSPAQRLARGLDIQGSAQIPALQAQARMMGRTITNDTEATNFLRELFAASGGNMGGNHTPEALLANQIGEGQFPGGMLGPKGPDAYKNRKVLQQAAQIWKQRPAFLGGDPGQLKEALFGVAGSDMANKGVRRTDHTSALLSSGKTLNDYVEVQNRFGPWFEMFQEGYDPAEAMRRVNRSQIDYHSANYTPFENNVATLVAPFYKFSKQSALTHANELATKPGGTLSHLLQTTGSLNDPDEVLPEYIREKLSIPVDKLPTQFLRDLLASGDPESKRYLTSLGAAYEDPLTWITGGPGELPVGTETLQEGLGRMNPLAKALYEIVTQTSPFQRDETGRGRLVKDQDPALGRLLSNVQQFVTGEKPLDEKLNAHQWSPFPVVESVLGNSPLSRLITSGKNLSDQRENSFYKTLLNLFTGLRAAEVTEAQRDAATQRLMNERRSEIPLAQTRSTTYVPKRLLPLLTPQQLRNLEDENIEERRIRRRQKQRSREQQDPLAALLAP